MMTKKLLFFLTFLLTMIGGGKLWAENYIPSGTAKSFTATTDIIVAGTGESTANSVIAAGKTENWITIPSEKYSSKTPLPDSEIDTPISNVYCLQVKTDGNTFKYEKRVIHFKVTGITGVKAIGSASSDRGFQIGATEVTGDLTENSSMNIAAGNTSAQNPVSCSGLDKTKTYIISIFAYSNDTYLYAVRFISDPYESNISVANLCYAVGTQGNNSNSNGLDRTVGGFNLTFGGGDGLKYNGGNQLLARNNTGTITITLDANNSKKNIKKVVFTRASAGDGTFTASDDASVTNSGTSITWEGAACKTITFTHSGESFFITNIAVTTDVAPVFEKLTPTVTISPTCASVKKATAGTFTTTATSSPKNFNWTWTPTSLANVEYYTKNDGGTKTANQIGIPGTFETTSESTTTGNNTIVASFAGNDFYNAVATAATYTLTVTEPVASKPDATVQTYPYAWNFDSGSSTWGNSSTQLPASDWEGTGTYYHYYVPDALTGFNIDAIKGLRFQNIGYLGLDWGWGHVYLTGGQVIIPSVPKGMIIKINASNNNQGGSATITPTNATYSGEGTATVNSSYQDFTFVTSSESSVTFTFSGVASIKSISVQKNDLTTFAFNNTESYYGKSEPTSSPSHSTGAYIGKATTFKYKIGRDQVLRTRVDVAPGFTDTGIEVNATNFSVSSNASTVLDASDYSLSKPSDSKIYYWGVKVKKPGTASLTYSFNGTSDYNAKNYTEMFTIEKDDPELDMISSFLIKTFGEANFTRSLTLNGLSLPVNDDNAGEVNVTYSSGTESVATVDPTTGEVSLVGPGVSIMKITLAQSDWNNAVEKTYKLIVNPTSGNNPSLSWDGDVSNVSVHYNQNVTRTATVSTSQTVHYESADPSIATVDDKGVVTGKGIGTTQILAYVDPTSEYNALQISYNVEVTSAGELGGFRFEPNNGKVNNGYSITPKLVFPTIPASGVTSLKVTQIQVTEREGSPVSETLTTDDAISNCDIIRVDASDDLRNKVNVTINGKKVGKARITVTFESEYYNTATATYDVEVTEAGTTNFSWTEGSGSPEYYTYAGDFMMLPALTGNSNGNYNYSSGAKNSSSYTEGGDSHSALYAYEYERKWDGSKFNIKWNNKNIKIGEGFPDFAIVTDEISSPGTASVFFGRGEGSSHPDTLMVFCETAGDVKLRAYDPQDHTKYCDATIHILPINNIEGTNAPATTVTSSMTYPYTWDFTTNFDMSVVGETDRYWTPIKDNSGNPTGDYTNGYGFFNLDWADTNTNNNTGDRFYKYFIAGASSSNTGYMHLFNGAMLQLKGSTSWANKMDRMRIYAYDSENKKGRLGFIGGPHNVKLFLPESSKRPSSYKIIVKASGAGGTVNVNADENKNQSLTAEAKIVTFDSSEITTGSDNSIILGFADARVYWIAMSTEAKTLNYPKTISYGGKNITTGVNYAANTYSYNEDLDIVKSSEANEGVTAYYASNFTVDKDAAAKGETEFAVTMTPAYSLEYVTANTGLLLKKEASGSAAQEFSCYMIANPRNVDTYSADNKIDGETFKNYLKGTGANSATVTGWKDGKTNFLMAYAYKYYTNLSDPGSAQGDYRFDRDWSFYPAMGDVTVPAQRAYLQVPQNVYVDREGNIVEMPSGSRSHRSGDTAEAPATKAMLSIVFDDEPHGGDSGETTGINTVSERNNDSDAWFTLQGVRVNAPAKGGIYIHKGRKVVVK